MFLNSIRTFVGDAGSVAVMAVEPQYHRRQDCSWRALPMHWQSVPARPYSPRYCHWDRSRLRRPRPHQLRRHAVLAVAVDSRVVVVWCRTTSNQFYPHHSGGLSNWLSINRRYTDPFGISHFRHENGQTARRKTKNNISIRASEQEAEELQ